MAADRDAPSAMAWDPKSPATLLLPIRDAETNELRVDPFLASDGVGCNSHERSALMKIIAASADYHKKNGDLKALSHTYRRALSECLAGWEDGDAMDDGEGLELLKLEYAVTHLSEIFLLLPQSVDVSGIHEDMWSVPGAVTADMVRYLRLNHMEDAYAVVGEGLDDLLQSSQPEQYGAVYWKLVQTLVLRGCLDDAWALISRHYLCRRCFEHVEVLDEYHAATIEQDREGFFALRALLLSAPLPGGRNDLNDDGLNDYGEGDDEEEDNKLLMDGVPRNAYKLWDMSSCSSSSDGPLSFDPNAAISMHRTWKREVIDNAALQGLVRRIPQLQTNVMAILSGKFDTVTFKSWSEALCAELLYQRPALCPRDMNVRTEKAMQKSGASVNAGFNKVILSVMNGDAGRAIEVLYQLGGAGGAALSATMTSLLCNLLVHADQIPPPDPSSSFNIQTELLLSASDAILSSLSSSEPDVGVRLSTELLLPYAKPNGDVRITATLGDTLARHGPSTDAEARVLLGLCRTLVARKSRRVLDGCIRLILFRYQHYLSEQRAGGAVHWLLKGIELEVLVYATTDDQREEKAWKKVLASGVCGTLLCSLCATKSQSLLRGLVSDDKETNVAHVYAQAKEVVESIQNDDPTGFAANIQDVKLLTLVTDTTRAVVDNENDRAEGDRLVAENIVKCLEDNADEEDDGVVASLAHYSMYGDLLALAHKMLQHDEESGATDEKYKTSFDVNGIRVLMEKLAVTAVGNNEEMEGMRLALGKGLTRALVAKNSKRANNIGLGTQSYRQLGSACASNLSSYSRSDQELIVKTMLDPTM